MERERESHIRPMESLEKRNFSFFSFFLSFFLVALLIASKILSLSLFSPLPATTTTTTTTITTITAHYHHHHHHLLSIFCSTKTFFFSGFFLSSEITGITWRRSWPSEMSNITRLSHTRTINSYYNL